ncbi:MAG: methionine--tRNA ligase, partial [Hyphomicrobiales bacterium]
MSKPKFYITTAIPYANGAPHIGHAYERIATDAIARFKRLDGYEVLFVTGMDEHGQKMQQTAAREGLTAMALADRTAKQFEDMGDELNARADDILRTTSERHRISVQEVWRRMAAKGDIYLSKYSGWYSVRDEAYYGEDETEERDGRRFAVKTGTPVEWVEEESYFFRLSAYADRLLRLYEERPDFIVPEHYKNEIVAFVKRGLNDLSISRTTFDWGIPVPGDPKHVMYVWVDALTNYLSATGFPDADAPRAGFWPADSHVIGKDITRFHAIYWPAFLMSADLPVPKQIVVHGFLFSRGEKMSKSVGNVVSPSDLVRSYGVDQTRYFFLREVPFGQDGNYSHEAIVARMNADLANDLGNRAQRSLSMIAKNLGGVLPAPGDMLDAD